jgi:1-acyl-sn-glycerol-3-phosphate acyltransferase
MSNSDTTQQANEHQIKNISANFKQTLYLVFGRIWATWGLISFAITFIIVFIPTMVSHLFSEKKGQDYFITVSRIWMTIWLYMVGCPVKVYGKENFKKGQTYVVVYNHNALLDVPLSAPFVPGGNKTIAKASFAKVPIFGLFYKRGSVLIERNKDSSRIKSFEDMKAVLRKDMHMCLYPEGTRNRTDEPLKPFFDGAFKLGIVCKKDIIPCVIVGTTKAMPIHKPFTLYPTQLHMYFMPAVSSENINTKTLKEAVFEIMKTKFIQESAT